MSDSLPAKSHREELSRLFETYSGLTNFVKKNYDGIDDADLVRSVLNVVDEKIKANTDRVKSLFAAEMKKAGVTFDPIDIPDFDVRFRDHVKCVQDSMQLLNHNEQLCLNSLGEYILQGNQILPFFLTKEDLITFFTSMLTRGDESIAFQNLREFIKMLVDGLVQSDDATADDDHTVMCYPLDKIGCGRKYAVMWTNTVGGFRVEYFDFSHYEARIQDLRKSEKDICLFFEVMRVYCGLWKDFHVEINKHYLSQGQDRPLMSFERALNEILSYAYQEIRRGEDSYPYRFNFSYAFDRLSLFQGEQSDPDPIEHV